MCSAGFSCLFNFAMEHWPLARCHYVIVKTDEYNRWQSLLSRGFPDTPKVLLVMHPVDCQSVEIIARIVKNLCQPLQLIRVVINKFINIPEVDRWFHSKSEKEEHFEPCSVFFSLFTLTINHKERKTIFEKWLLYLRRATTVYCTVTASLQSIYSVQNLQQVQFSQPVYYKTSLALHSHHVSSSSLSDWDSVSHSHSKKYSFSSRGPGNLARLRELLHCNWLSFMEWVLQLCTELLL
jgi:hypothetical protein